MRGAFFLESHESRRPKTRNETLRITITHFCNNRCTSPSTCDVPADSSTGGSDKGTACVQLCPTVYALPLSLASFADHLASELSKKHERDSCRSTCVREMLARCEGIVLQLAASWDSLVLRLLWKGRRAAACVCTHARAPTSAAAHTHTCTPSADALSAHTLHPQVMFCTMQPTAKPSMA